MHRSAPGRKAVSWARWRLLVEPDRGSTGRASLAWKALTRVPRSPGGKKGRPSFFFCTSAGRSGSLTVGSKAALNGLEGIPPLLPFPFSLLSSTTTRSRREHDGGLRDQRQIDRSRPPQELSLDQRFRQRASQPSEPQARPRGPSSSKPPSCGLPYTTHSSLPSASSLVRGRAGCSARIGKGAEAISKRSSFDRTL